MKLPRKGYWGLDIIRRGGILPSRITLPTGTILGVSNIPRETGIVSHVENVKRQNIVLDAATIFACYRHFVTPETEVGLSRAEFQHYGATGGDHAAHAVKPITFGGKSIVEVYEDQDVDEVFVIGLRTMLGLVTDVPRRANLSIDKRLENNPQRLAQLAHAVGSPIDSLDHARKLARALEHERRFFDKDMLDSMRGSFGGDKEYDAMLSVYEEILSAPPRDDETPGLMLDMMDMLAKG